MHNSFGRVERNESEIVHIDGAKTVSNAYIKTHSSSVG